MMNHRIFSFVIICLLLIFILFRSASLLQTTIHNLQQIVRTTEEQRKGREYQSYGYDYVTRIVSMLPDPLLFPVTRYISFAHNIDILLPINSKAKDDRIMIGIDIPDGDLKEGIITTAHRLESRSNGLQDYWAFNTVNDFDTLSAIGFIMDDYQRISPIKITLFANASETTVIGSWMYTPDIGSNNFFKFTLPEHLNNFSFNRGSEDFIITLEQFGNAPLQTLSHVQFIQLYGIKVNLEDYRIVHKSGNVFTAIKKDFLETIERDNLDNWKKFLFTLKQ